MTSLDLWHLISFHLKPRHLRKLILTSKEIKEAVDTEIYWTRIAAHLCFRKKLGRWYHMANLGDRGYKRSMDGFLMDPTIPVETQIKQFLKPKFRDLSMNSAS